MPGVTVGAPVVELALGLPGLTVGPMVLGPRLGLPGLTVGASVGASATSTVSPVSDSALAASSSAFSSAVLRETL